MPASLKQKLIASTFAIAAAIGSADIEDDIKPDGNAMTSQKQCRITLQQETPCSPPEYHGYGKLYVDDKRSSQVHVNRAHPTAPADPQDAVPA